MDKLLSWIKTTPYADFKLSIASADASFRKYYRLEKSEESVIVMDSSLESASLPPFLDVTQCLLDAGVKAPQILEKNEKDAYLILEDFGNIQLLDALNSSNFELHYKNAIDEILKMQDADTKDLPLYNRDFLHLEMDLMQEWYLEKKLSYSLSTQENALINTTLNAISTVVLQQPQDVFVHRDFHSRNIMLTADGKIGVIDYQDAMSGAISYDLVSLLKDCYIKFDREEIEKLALYFKNNKDLDVSDTLFLKWFDFMGLQRHIKVLGIFSRLHLRDKKDGYLKDIPLVLEYTIETALRYDETREFALFLQGITE